MEKIHSKLRRTDYYDFGHGLTLMNVLSKTEDGKLDRIDTYIFDDYPGMARIVLFSYG